MTSTWFAMLRRPARLLGNKVLPSSERKPRPQSLAASYLHLVFSTNNRIPYLLDTGMRSEMHSFLAGVSRGVGCQTILVGGVEDHVHVLGRLGRSTTVADWVKEAKMVSTTWAKTRAIPNCAVLRGRRGMAHSR